MGRNGASAAGDGAGGDDIAASENASTLAASASRAVPLSSGIRSSSSKKLPPPPQDTAIFLSSLLPSASYLPSRLKQRKLWAPPAPATEERGMEARRDASRRRHVFKISPRRHPPAVLGGRSFFVMFFRTMAEVGPTGAACSLAAGMWTHWRVSFFLCAAAGPRRELVPGLARLICPL